MNGEGAAAGGGGRAEVDTSAPFKSVREAVDRFGGSAAWSSHLIKRMFAPPKKQEGIQEEPTDLEEQAARLEKELSVKENETLDVLKELEFTKNFIADLKLKIQSEEAATFFSREEAAQTEVSVAKERQTENAGTDDDDMGGLDERLQEAHGRSVLKELEQAKANLNRTTSDLAAIRASVYSLRNEIAKEKVLVERCREKVCSRTALISSLEGELVQAQQQQQQTLRALQTRREDPADIFMEIKKMASELEQLRNAAKASKSEANLLAAEIEQMKASIGTAEVRCLAAKKIEDAARVAEALALAEIKILLSNEASGEDLRGTDDGVITLSVEEFSDLAAKAREADESFRKKVGAAMERVDEANRSESESLRKLEEAKLQVDECKKALHEALARVDAAKLGKMAVEEALHRCRSAPAASGQYKRRSLHEPLKFKNAAHRRIKDSSHNMDAAVDVSKGSLTTPMLSIGQILSMKLMGPDGYDKSVSYDTFETCNVSLGQIMNRRRRAAVVYSSGTNAAQRKLSGKRKKFAFTGLSVFLAKQAKSKKKRG